MNQAELERGKQQSVASASELQKLGDLNAALREQAARPAEEYETQLNQLREEKASLEAKLQEQTQSVEQQDLKPRKQSQSRIEEGRATPMPDLDLQSPVEKDVSEEK